MKGIFFLFLYMPLMMHGQESYKGINFEDMSWDAAKSKARAENKYIFMDVFTTWCGPCRQMDREIYTCVEVGEVMNDNFISIKVQADTSTFDNDQVKKRYVDASSITKMYSIAAFPTFLFFAPDGQLVYREVGFKTTLDFIKLANQALDPQNILYYSSINEYRKGQRNIDMLDKLAVYAESIGDRKLSKQIARDYIRSVDRCQLMTRENIVLVLEVAEDSELADSLAIEYKRSIFDYLEDVKLCTNENLSFINRFPNLFNSKDNLFRLCYYFPNKVDSAIQINGWAGRVVKTAIMRDVLKEKRLKDGKSSYSTEDWNELRSRINRKYFNVDAYLLVLDQQIEYYKSVEDWEKYTGALIERVQRYGAFGSVAEADFNLNNHAWELFLHSFNSRELEVALSWSNRAINMVANSNDQFNLPNWMDTKANILYKLGRTREAVYLENEVILLDPKTKTFQDNLEKMRNGRPTWPMRD